MSQKLYLPDTGLQASYCDLSYFNYEFHQHQWKNIISSHPFNHKLSLFLPHCSAEVVKQLLDTNQLVYYIIKLPLVKLLDEQFYKQYIQSTTHQLLLHTLGTRIDTDNVITLDNNGHLIMNLNKATYESFGIVGKKQTMMDKQRHRFVIDINLKEMKFNSKMFQRLKWCFENTMTQDYNFVAVNIDKVSGASTDILWSEEIVVNKQDIKMNINQIDNIDIPQFSTKLDQPYADITPGWENDALSAMEWIGLVNLNATRLKSSANSFISTYQTPFINDKTSFGTIITWTGFIPTTFIMNTMINTRKLMVSNTITKWASLTVWGYRDSPFTWNNRQHYYYLNGENDYTFLLLPPHDNRQPLICYKMLGTHHSS
ncbi:unnamed protein product [Cunninghamella blakesleeana]